MKNSILRILFLFCMAIMVAFTLVPPPHQIPDNNRNVATVFQQLPPVPALTLTTTDLTAPKGGEVCVTVAVSGFEKILTMQYSMNWDPNLLKFKDLKNFSLPALDKRNFGQHLASKGILTFSWYDQNLRGLSKPDGFVLYDVCFEVIGEAGIETSLSFTDKPTVVEISNAAGTFLDLRTVSGKITIQ